MNNMNMNNMNNMGMNPMMGGNTMGMGMNPMMGGNTMGMGMNPMMGGNGMGMGMNPMMGGNGMGMGMNPMMGGNTMGMGMNPMMGGNGMGMGMNPMMMNFAMGMNNAGGYVNIGDEGGWNLIFEEKNGSKRINITISPDKTVQAAINMYKIKTNQVGNDQMKFIFNGKQLATSLTLSQSGLQNSSVITVVSLRNVEGA